MGRNIDHLSHIFICALLLLLMLLSSRNEATPVLGNETDLQALMEFKDKITRDELGVLTSWNRTMHMCQWHGITCSSRGQRVVTLQLNGSKLVGSVSPHLGNLSFLRVLNLENNSFGDEIPRQIWDLRRLRHLILRNNSLVGVLPSNLSCSSSKLNRLDLARNLLSGDVPSALGCFLHLKFLRLFGNNFTGTIPTSLGNLSSLEVLILSENSMTGALPESLGQLRNLEVLYVGSNGYSGSIASAIFNLSNLREFGVELNQFQGGLPAEFGINMPYVEGFFIGGNQFSGSIPPSVSNATRLVVFSATDNKFTGSFRSDLSKLNNLLRFHIQFNHIGSWGGSTDDLIFICSLVNATALEELALSGNNFGGPIPECIGNLSTRLNAFAVENNKLSGKIPATIGKLINLEWLSLHSNRLSGHIPFSIGSLDKLQVLSFDMNNLSGNIPVSFGSLTLLTRLSISENNIEGSIPPSLGECKSLIALDLSVNKLSGPVPPELFKSSPFSIGIRLDGNRLVGNIPSQVGYLKSISELVVSRNLLSGELQNTSLDSCESLQLLDISGNSFLGTIPSSWSSLKGLQTLNLSKNKLTGEIPSFLESLKLDALDLSHNDFEGTIPSRGVFSNTSGISVVGNSKLCGGVLELHFPKCNLHGSNKIGKMFLILIPSLIFGAILIASLILIYWLRRKGNKSTPSETDHQLTEISYNDLNKATNGFSSTNLIGSGSFGSVYKGVLDHQNRKVVAIKVLNLLQQGASKSFMAECEVLRNVRHRNLVKILTVCSSIDHQGRDFRALVYEFMSNGDLDEWLHQNSRQLVGSSQRPRILDFLQRLCIAIDVAYALDYLHNQYATPIVHCDLKPSNILLDDDMTAHLSDFGLARFLLGIMRDSSQNETGSVGIRGSIGYIAPEYGMAREVSTNGDVYSYGVLLLEMFTGKTPTDEIFQDGLNLHEFAKGALLTNVWDVIDPTLLYESQLIQEYCLTSILRIGVACSCELPRERMNIHDVVAQLLSIKQKLLKA